MRISTILLSVVLSFNTIYSKAIDNDAYLKGIQKDVIMQDDFLEIIHDKNGNFINKFHCSNERKFCEKIKNDLDYAFDTFSNALEIYQPIVFETFIDDLSRYGLGVASGAIVDKNVIALKSSNDPSSPPIMYHQALVKQLKLNKEPDYKKNDFVMIINNSTSKYNEDRELRPLLIHEMLHGLGFLSQIELKKLDNDETIKFLDLDPIVKEENSQYSVYPNYFPSYSNKLSEISNGQEYMDELNNSKVLKFNPLSVYDKNIVSLKTGEKIFENLQSFYKEINDKCLPKDGLEFKNINNKFYKECFEKLNIDTQNNITHVVEDYYYKGNSLGILTKDGDVVPIQTLEGRFLLGSSIHHPRSSIIEEYYNAIVIKNDASEFVDLIDSKTGKLTNQAAKEKYDGNFVLYYVGFDDLTFEEKLEVAAKNNNKYGLIGDGIVKVLKTLGWTVKGEKRSDDIYYVDEGFNIPESSAFEYYFMKKNNALRNDSNTDSITVSIPEEKPSTVVNETETPLHTDSINQDTEVEVDVEVTSSPNDESDSDSDIEEQQ